MSDPKYLLVTHIPFARNSRGEVTLDALWARDLEGIAGSGWNIRVCAPELASGDALRTWGPGAAILPPGGAIEFAGFPALASRKDIWKWPLIRNVIRREVSQARLVHTSNLFAPYVGLSYAHDLAVRTGKKTVFVIAEDFHDMLDWEWVRLGATAFERARRAHHLRALDRRVVRSAATASLTFLHTPAAVTRYRTAARNGIAIRQPGHEREDVIDDTSIRKKCAQALSGETLVLAAACRHKELKGLDFLIRAIHLLAARGLRVDARLYGGGEQNASLQKLSRDLGLAEQIDFPGSLPPGREVYDAIARCHIFAMPHRTTDFGRAFFDAMAGATPVLAFRTAASADTVRDGVDGLITPLDDVESYAAAIQRLHCDRQLLVRLSRAARERALLNTRSDWYRLRSEWTRSLLTTEDTHG